MTRTSRLLLLAALVAVLASAATAATTPAALPAARLPEKPMIAPVITPRDSKAAYVNVILALKGTAYGTDADAVKAQQDSFLNGLRAASIGYDLASKPLTGLLNIVPLKLHDAAQVAQVRKMANVAKIIPAAKVKLTDPTSRSSSPGNPATAPELHKRNIDPKAFSLLQPHVQTGVSTAHARGVTGKGVRVAVMDTGVDASHPALGGGCFGKPGCVIAGFTDLVDTDTKEPNDCGLDGHGTRVVGVLAGRTPAKSAEKFVGVAPDAQVFVYRVYDCNAVAVSTAFAEALELAITRDKVDIINISLGQADPWALGSVGLALDAIAETHPQVSIVSVAGNEGQKPFNVAGPGSLHPILSVGSLDNRFVLARTMDVGKVALDYLYSVSNPIAPADVSPAPVTVLSPFTATNATACDDSNLYPRIAPPEMYMNRTVVVFQGTCPPSSLEVMVSALGSLGARSVILALTSNDLSLPSSRLQVAVDTKWAKVPANVAARAFSPKGAVTAANVNITLGMEDRAVRHTNAGQLSAFTSFGPTATFDFKPEIVAVGGSAIAPQPMDKGVWGLNDGTSFSAPYVAGCLALLRQTMGRAPSAQDLRRILMNTAVPAFERDVKIPGIQPLPVQGQGAGLVSMSRALSGLAQVGPDAGLALLPPGFLANSPTDIASTDTMALDGTGFPTYVRRVVLRNPTQVPTTYFVEHKPALSLSGGTDAMVLAPSKLDVIVKKQATPKYPVRKPSSAFLVTVGAHDTAEFEVRITPDAGATKDTGALFSGYIQMTPGQSPEFAQFLVPARAVYLPYSGYNGNLAKAPVFPNEIDKALKFSFRSMDVDSPIMFAPQGTVASAKANNVVVPFKYTDNNNMVFVQYQTSRPARQLMVMVVERRPKNVTVPAPPAPPAAPANPPAAAPKLVKRQYYRRRSTPAVSKSVTSSTASLTTATTSLNTTATASLNATATANSTSTTATTSLASSVTTTSLPITATSTTSGKAAATKSVAPASTSSSSTSSGKTASASSTSVGKTASTSSSSAAQSASTTSSSTSATTPVAKGTSSPVPSNLASSATSTGTTTTSTSSSSTAAAPTTAKGTSSTSSTAAPSSLNSSATTASTSAKSTATSSTTTTSSTSATTSTAATSSATTTTSPASTTSSATTTTTSATTTTSSVPIPTPPAPPTVQPEFEEVYVGYLFKTENIGAAPGEVFWQSDVSPVMVYDKEADFDVPAKLNTDGGEYRIKVVVWWGKDTIADADMLTKGVAADGPIFKLS
ncbi:hypothetical protein H9P43_000198 [Blastocladiella emersonii ATCC 22665]|nr:hypothetical protein H9P43_000198 [Blastocladiella emersonii ATCC 22665]